MNVFRLVPFDLIGEIGSYAGIGSRKLTQKETLIQFKLGFILALIGYKVHSGAADGSDTAFELGAKAAFDLMCKINNQKSLEYSKVMKVFLPWKDFNGRQPGPGYIIRESEEAMMITSKYHPAWDKLNSRVKSLMSRNAMQALDESLANPVKFSVCTTNDGAYTPDLCTPKTGGTAQAIRILGAYNVPIFNLKHPPHRERILKWTEDYFDWFHNNYSIDLNEYIGKILKEHTGNLHVISGDLIDIAKNGMADVIIHGCNIHNVKGSGFAEKLFKEFPEAYAADQMTKKGDPKKLGTYSSAKVTRNGKEFTVINAYTQLNYSRDENELNIDYEALRTVMKQINSDFKNKAIFSPKIGTGLASGCWFTISNIIEFTSRNKNNFTVIEFSDEPAYELVKNIEKSNKAPEYLLFYSKFDTFSQWHPSVFVEDGITFVHCEQYMMYKKAMLFNDINIAQKILLEKDPQKCKNLGKLVKPFIQKIWDQNREKIIFNGSILKYTQNEKMLKELIESRDMVLVEASPTDDIYGVKLGKNHPDIRNPLKWKGLNLLGKALERTRTHISHNYDKYNLSSDSVELIIRTNKSLENTLNFEKSSDGQLTLI
jgi:ribA/ribD-fused uncharacterized protein